MPDQLPEGARVLPFRLRPVDPVRGIDEHIGELRRLACGLRMVGRIQVPREGAREELTEIISLAANVMAVNVGALAQLLGSNSPE